MLMGVLARGNLFWDYVSFKKNEVPNVVWVCAQLLVFWLLVLILGIWCLPVTR